MKRFIGVPVKACDKKFMAGRLTHNNLMRLKECCGEPHKEILAFKNIPNTSFDKLIVGRTLTFKQRMDILLSVSSALVYLYVYLYEREISHGYHRTCNILVNADFNTKLDEFDLPEVEIRYRRWWYQADETLDTTTMAYLPPPTGSNTHVDVNIYSFVVVVLEALMGDRIELMISVYGLWHKKQLTKQLGNAAYPSLMVLIKM